PGGSRSSRPPVSTPTEAMRRPDGRHAVRPPATRGDFMRHVQFDGTNAICGLTLIALGSFFIYQCLGLDLGTAVRMGPGYFPLILALILTGLGAIVLAQAMRVAGEPIGPIALRGMLFILPAPVF